MVSGSFGGVQGLANDFVVNFSRQNIDLSRNKSLQTLTLPAMSIGWALQPGGAPNGPSFLRHVLSTITSPTFFQIVVLYCDINFLSGGLYDPVAGTTEGASLHDQFELFREVHKVRGFRLVLSARVSGDAGEEPVRILEKAVAEEKAIKRFDDFTSEPVVWYDPQGRTSFG